MRGAAPRDADLLALELERDEQRVATWVREIASAGIDDGVVFAVDRLQSQQIREGDLYPGMRVTVPANIGKARLNLVLDVNFGDPVTPGAICADFPQLLDYGRAHTRRGGAARPQRRWHILETSPKSCGTSSGSLTH